MIRQASDYKESNMEKTKVNTKQRVQFDFSQEALIRLEDLQERLEASTKAEVVRNALKLYEWFTTQIEPDSIIEVQNKEGKTVFRIPLKVLLS
jgi:hypothetical protein